MSQFEQLSKLTSIVADTGEIEEIKKYQPDDATTNPSLILKAAQIPEYQYLISDAINYAKQHDQQVNTALNKLLVNFGTEITKIVKGVVSTEVDARLSFDTNKTVEQAKNIINLYQEAGVNKDRVLIKIAATWEGIRAAEILERDYDIHCNITLLFSIIQAAAAAEANAFLISPFVGRITDWYKKAQNVEHFEANDDPGVKSVTEIYQYFKTFNYKTIVMGASFRNIDQVLHLAGCDKLTLAPSILQTLSESKEQVKQYLSPDLIDNSLKKFDVSESNFRWIMNENPMATEKLAEGIRKFAADAVKLEELLQNKLNE